MNRTAQRLITTAALLNGGNAPFPTMAGDQVFDSQRDDVPAANIGKHLPVIIAHAESDTRTVTPGGQGVRELMFYLQIGVLSSKKNDDGTIVAGWPQSDGTLEAFLDLLEWQIEAALWGPGLWAMRWRELFPPGKFESTPVYFDPQDTRVRLAARDLGFTLDGFPMDEMPPMLRDDDPDYTAVLPDRLIQVFDWIDADGAGDCKAYAAQMRTMLESQSLPAATKWPPLTSLVASMTLPTATAPPSGASPIPQVTADLLKPVEGT